MASKILTTYYKPNSEKGKTVELSPALAKFASEMMQPKLTDKWWQFQDSYGKCRHERLLKMLKEHVDKAIERHESDKKLGYTHFQQLTRDVIDVANIAMMIGLNEVRRHK